MATGTELEATQTEDGDLDAEITHSRPTLKLPLHGTL